MYIHLFHSNGEEWARNRKPTQRNMLRPITVARYFPKMSEISDEFVQKLKEKGIVTDIQSQLLAFAIERKWTPSETSARIREVCLLHTSCLWFVVVTQHVFSVSRVSVME